VRQPALRVGDRPLYHAALGEDLLEGLPDDYWVRIDADHRRLLECLRSGDIEAARRQTNLHLDYIVAPGASSLSAAPSTPSAGISPPSAG
jgi:DNA-binding FadR family transcriptional regulator